MTTSKSLKPTPFPSKPIKPGASGTEFFLEPLCLERVHFFEPLTREQLARVRATSHQIEMKAGESLFVQGDSAERFFLVQHGSIKLFLLSDGGEEKVVEVARPGQCFAEAVMFLGPEPHYPVHASALTDTRLLAFDNQTLLGLLEESRELGLHMLGAMSRRLHGLLREIDELTLHNATYRMITYLLAQARGTGDRIHLAMPKQIVASRLSIKPETFSRILARLRDQGLIEVTGDSVTLHDIQALRALLKD